MKHKSVRWTMCSSWVSMSWPRRWSWWNWRTWRVNSSRMWRIECPGKAPILFLTRLCSGWLNVWSPCPNFNLIQMTFPKQFVSNLHQIGNWFQNFLNCSWNPQRPRSKVSHPHLLSHLQGTKIGMLIMTICLIGLLHQDFVAGIRSYQVKSSL